MFTYWQLKKAINTLQFLHIAPLNKQVLLLRVKRDTVNFYTLNLQ